MSNKPNTAFEIQESGLYIVKDAVASFPHLDKPNSFDGEAEKAKYSINVLFPIDSPAYADMKKAVGKLMPKGAKPDVSKLPFKEAKSVPESWQDAHGVSAYTCKLVNKNPIKCFGANGLPVDPASIKGGDRISVAFEPYWFESKYGVFCQLQAKAVLVIGEYLEFGGGGGVTVNDASVFGAAVSKPVHAPTEEDPFGDDVPF